MNYLNQLFALPYAQLWIPGVIFVAVASALYYFLRPSPHLAGSSDDPQLQVESVSTVPLATAQIGQQPTEAKKDKRQAARRTGNPVAIEIASPENKDNPEWGAILDRNMGGMRIAALREFEAGAILAIRPSQAAEMVPWIDVEVRSCRPSKEMAGEFDLGCQFVKTPPYSILLLFG